MIYFGNAATTRVSRAVLQEMNHAFIELYANPSSSHKAGLQAKDLVQKAREQCADAIGAHPEQILFTSGGTESNNLAVLGLARSLKKRQKTHLITTQVEHPSILAAMQFLEGEGFDVTYLPVTKSGSLPPALVESAFQENTGLVSIMAVNNETGNEYPVEEIAHLCHNRGVLFHTDFVQGFGQRSIDLKDIDFLSVSAHKFHGPKGVGFLYGKDWRLLSPLLFGGGQEGGLRSGTENVPGIVGMGLAAKTATLAMEENQKKFRDLAQSLLSTLHRKGIPFHVNGDSFHQSPKILNLRFPGVDAESLVLLLSNLGVMVSVGSACSAHEVAPSHVLLAMGLSAAEARSSIRVSFCETSTKENVAKFCSALSSALSAVKFGVTKCP